MSVQRPEFVDSPYFVPEIDGWHLTEDAPDSVREEFDEYMQYENDLEEVGVDI